MIETEPPVQAENDDNEWHSQGEAPDHSAMDIIRLAHRAVDKFPELTRRYQKFIGAGAVLSSAVIVLATIAINKRLKDGDSIEKILAEITPEEIESAAKKNRWKLTKKESKSGDRPQH
ncbi:MAG: hypothetical protein AB7P33_03385 [Dehalococcoidia bacterium]